MGHYSPGSLFGGDVALVLRRLTTCRKSLRQLATLIEVARGVPRVSILLPQRLALGRSRRSAVAGGISLSLIWVGDCKRGPVPFGAADARAHVIVGKGVDKFELQALVCLFALVHPELINVEEVGA